VNLLQLPFATLEGGLTLGPRSLGLAGPSAALGKIVGLSRDDVGCSIDRNHDHLQSMVDDAMRLDGTRRSNCHIAATPHFADHRPWVFESVRILSVNQGCALNCRSYFVPHQSPESSSNIISKSVMGFRAAKSREFDGVQRDRQAKAPMGS